MYGFIYPISHICFVCILFIDGVCQQAHLFIGLTVRRYRDTGEEEIPHPGRKVLFIIVFELYYYRQCGTECKSE